MSLSERLKEERKRLFMTQEKLAILTFTTKKSIGTYEKAHTVPSATFLGHLSSLGFDVVYILTGTRSDTSPFTEEEKQLVELYRSANASIKLAVQATLNSGVKAGHTVNVRGNANKVHIE